MEVCSVIKSAIANGLQVHVVGGNVNQSEILGRTVSREYARRLATLGPDTLVVGLDGGDTLLAAGATPAEWHRRFSSFGADFVWSGENNMYPSFVDLPPRVKEKYPGQWPADWKAWEGDPPDKGRWKRPPYPYLNYGGWIARAGRALEVMHAAAAYVAPCAPANETLHPPGGCLAQHDQHAAQLALVDPVCMADPQDEAHCVIDVYASVFYSGHLHCEGLVPHADGSWSNTLSGNKPLVAHFNGGAKTACEHLGVKSYMYSRKTGWYHRVKLDRQTPIYVEGGPTPYGQLCPAEV
ncbi:hypothetical protein HXX76_015782 [Chlamydomonas incerta]|uniref:Uncharacterized protein n=1 Tax=Chlamydomonas incerta TaxID=51695 RepID=A0A835SDK1_CHLIN|nr:hypothetical protein HXX76_015782 [Chlamydomonas incerta]|eukprot:KAG2422762.1 hypothetical protein HXX76_015782 [Chlamydomonas incerta]